MKTNQIKLYKILTILVLAISVLIASNQTSHAKAGGSSTGGGVDHGKGKPGLISEQIKAERK